MLDLDSLWLRLLPGGCARETEVSGAANAKSVAVLLSLPSFLPSSGLEPGNRSQILLLALSDLLLLGIR